MASALKLGLAGAVFVFASTAALAGSASAAYYPSLGYGQTPPDPPPSPTAPASQPNQPPGPSADDATQDPSAPPGAPAQDSDTGYLPPEAYPPGVSGQGAESYASQSGSSGSGYARSTVRRYVYDSGWHGAGTYSWGGWGGRYGVHRGWRGRYWTPYDGRGHAQGGAWTYDYDSGWRALDGGGAPPPPCPFAGPPPGDAPYPACPTAYLHGGPYVGPLPDLFFADAGGVGPDYINAGGGNVFVFAGEGARVSAFASARARAGMRFRRHGVGLRGGRRGGCRCGRGR